MSYPLFLIPLIVAFGFTTLLHSAPLELDVLRQQYDKVYAERVTSPHETALAGLNTKFTAALDADIATSKQAGKLDDVLAISADRKRVTERHPLPAEDAEGTPESLIKLRAIYREQSARIETDRATNANALIEPFSVKLQELEVNLTKADRIEDATQVRTFRETLNTAEIPAPTMVVSPSSLSGGSPAPAPATSKIKGNDRKAAEWILSLAVAGSNTLVNVSSGSQGMTCRRLADLPKADFFITFFHIDGFQVPLPRPVSNEEMLVLSGLERLNRFQINKAGITDEGLHFVASCPEVQWIHLHGLNLTDECFRHFAGLKKLKSIDFSDGCKAMNGTGVVHLQESPVEMINFVGGSYEDSALQKLHVLKNLKALNFTLTRVSDAGIGALLDLPKLTSLNVTQTNVTPNAILKLRGLKLTGLSLGKAGSWTEITPQFPALAAAFPDVVETTLPRSGIYTVANLEPLVAAFPKLQRLSATDPKFEPGALKVLIRFTNLENLSLSSAFVGDSDFAVLSEMKSLEVLTLGSTQVTDTGLAALAEIKKLKTLAFSKIKVTPAGLEAFKKARPDVILK